MSIETAKAFFRACPECAGEVHTVASKCKHCGAELRPARSEDRLPAEPTATDERTHTTEAARGNAPAPASDAPLAASVPAPPPTPLPVPRPPTTPTAQPARSASSTPAAPSAASRRWLLFGAAVLLVAIGMALGVLIERSDAPQPAASAATATRTFTAPRALPPDDDLAPPDDFDLAPNAGAPSFRFRIQPLSPRPHGASGDAPTVDEFARQLGDELCAKLTDCADVDPAVALLCRTIAGNLDGSELAAQVARGECSYDGAAAGACVDGLATIDCDVDQQDAFAMMRVVEAMMSCADAVRCGGW